MTSILLYPIMRKISLNRSIRINMDKKWVKNNNLEAARQAVSLLKESEYEIELFDDGDDFEESVYNYSPFIDEVEKKLKDNPDFKIRCLFNEGNRKLKFIQKFVSESRVEIYARTDKERLPDLHYKIIDGGVKGIISDHKKGDSDRKGFVA